VAAASIFAPPAPSVLLCNTVPACPSVARARYKGLTHELKLEQQKGGRDRGALAAHHSTRSGGAHMSTSARTEIMDTAPRHYLDLQTSPELEAVTCSRRVCRISDRRTSQAPQRSPRPALTSTFECITAAGGPSCASVTCPAAARALTPPAPLRRRLAPSRGSHHHPQRQAMHSPITCPPAAATVACARPVAASLNPEGAGLVHARLCTTGVAPCPPTGWPDLRYLAWLPVWLSDGCLGVLLLLLLINNTAPWPLPAAAAAAARGGRRRWAPCGWS
jgi:hypothetical protein